MFKVLISAYLTAKLIEMISPIYIFQNNLFNFNHGLNRNIEGSFFRKLQRIF